MAKGHVETGTCSATPIQITKFKYKIIVHNDLLINNCKCLITVIMDNYCSSGTFHLAI